MHKYTEKMVDYCRKELDFKEQISSYSYKSMSVCIIEFEDAVDILSKEYTELTVSILDGIIWRKYQISNR